MFIFVKRTYKNGWDENDQGISVVIKVPRFFCPNNYKKRKRGKKKQYTITILPGFLVPYSIIPLDAITEAVDRYIKEPGTKQQAAAFIMYCITPLSFRLHFSRIKNRLSGWITFLTQLLITLGGEIKGEDVKNIAYYENPLQAKWKRFKLFVVEYLLLYSRIPGGLVIKERFYYQYIHAVLSHNHMGLGP